ncbi:hypothetical protein HPP92_017994 [Vanilla planifolia]|uniref:RING-type domain-containing protein n=1 Tax=Vanilla planifolia TaxID=51239 RepID=A0A835Q687_VANPL|nr:hypothetical protein HPP92_017994 [Vanilla planifolia]
MGLSSLPTPSDGVLTLVLMKTVLTISILKQIFRSALHALGLAPDAAAAGEWTFEASSVSSPAFASEASLTERFQIRVKPMRFGSVRCLQWQADCRVCLGWFQPESVVNCLPCGHLFHKNCVERWIDYRNSTCPLCRCHILPADAPADMFGIPPHRVY